MKTLNPITPVKNGWGGRRPGAGRKPKRVIFENDVRVAEGRIADRLPRLVDNLFKLADGVAVKTTNAKGQDVVFLTPPDRAANEYLINRVLGKPIERKEHGDVGEFEGVKVLQDVDLEAM